ncbi:hypothetical protein FRC08_016142, partial [Ceratobasidium sp. 394]
MLPVEVLYIIFAAVPELDMPAVMLANRLFYAIAVQITRFEVYCAKDLLLPLRLGICTDYFVNVKRLSLVCEEPLDEHLVELFEQQVFFHTSLFPLLQSIAFIGCSTRPDVVDDDAGGCPHGVHARLWPTLIHAIGTRLSSVSLRLHPNPSMLEALALHQVDVSSLGIYQPSNDLWGQLVAWQSLSSIEISSWEISSATLQALSQLPNLYTLKIVSPALGHETTSFDIAVFPRLKQLAVHLGPDTQPFTFLCQHTFVAQVEQLELASLCSSLGRQYGFQTLISVLATSVVNLASLRLGFFGELSELSFRALQRLPLRSLYLIGWQSISPIALSALCRYMPRLIRLDLGISKLPLGSLRILATRLPLLKQLTIHYDLSFPALVGETSSPTSQMTPAVCAPVLRVRIDNEGLWQRDDSQMARHSFGWIYR